MANSREGANKNLNSELNCFTNDHSLHQPKEHYDRLIITSAPYSGMELILFLRGGKHQWSLGANKQADFYLPDPRFKQHQVTIARTGSIWMISCHSDCPPIYVNNEPCFTVAVEHGDHIKVGEIEFSFAEATPILTIQNEFVSLPELA